MTRPLLDRERPRPYWATESRRALRAAAESLTLSAAPTPFAPGRRDWATMLSRSRSVLAGGLGLLPQPAAAATRKIQASLIPLIYDSFPTAWIHVYNKRSFRNEDATALRQVMERYPFATLISQHDGEPF